MSPQTTLIRPCQADDLSAVTAIYAHHVTQGRGSFELDPPLLQETPLAVNGYRLGLSAHGL